MYSKANQAFVFTFGGDQLLRMGDGPMFYHRKTEAIRAALRQGLLVDERGYVTSIDEESGSGKSNGVRKEGLSDLERRATLRTPVGTRVRFTPNPASLLLYSKPPESGEEGAVTTVSLGAGKSSFMRGPGGGILYIKWKKTGVQGVAPQDVEVLGRK
jgi:hypothetical protein